PPAAASSSLHAPATPPISTLSLHDALPISLEQAEIDGVQPVDFLVHVVAQHRPGVRRCDHRPAVGGGILELVGELRGCRRLRLEDRKSTRLNSSHSQISYAVFCLKKKNHTQQRSIQVLRPYRRLRLAPPEPLAFRLDMNYSFEAHIHRIYLSTTGHTCMP